MASAPPKKPPLKGILKQPKTSTPPPPTRATSEAEQIALRHAAIIQDRKDLESTVLESIVRLTDLPRTRDAPHSSSNPAPSDIAEFKTLVRLFQPSDYDDLIEERNTCGLCGYCLCGSPRRAFEGAGAWKLVNTGRKDFNIVQKKELEKWCSEECARRALYIKVQLNETAAWERAGIPNIGIELLGEDCREITPARQLARELEKLRLSEEWGLAEGLAALALERGDVQTPKRGLVDVDLVENIVTRPPAEPRRQSDDTSGEASHMHLEGHRTKFGA